MSDLQEVIKLISQVIADFADGEISQAASLFDSSIDLPRYLDKSFWKTASLIAASCRSAAVFSDCDTEGGFVLSRDTDLKFKLLGCSPSSHCASLLCYTAPSLSSLSTSSHCLLPA